MASELMSRVYYWEGVDKAGAHVSGKLSAKTEEEVRTELHKRGIVVGDISTNPLLRLGLFRKSIKTEDITLMTRLLATLFGSGIPLIQALDSMISGEENHEMRMLLQRIRDDIDTGSSFSAALRKHPKYFDELYCNLVDVGEQSGALEDMLLRIAQQKENVEILKSKVKKALVYPAFVIGAAMIITAVILVFVVPQFKALFASSNVKFPFVTGVVIGISSVLQKYWWMALILIAAAVGIFKYFLHSSERFAYLVDKLLLRLPIIGIIIRKSIIARFTQTLMTCFESGMPIVEALRQSSSVTGNLVYKTALLKVREDVKVGQQLYVSLSLTELFPVIVIKMIAAGEESGSLAAMLAKITEFYQRQVNFAVDNLSSLLEPIIIVFLGVVIGGLIVALYLPIFQLGLAF